MDERTKEWLEIIAWFAAPVIFCAAIAYYEFAIGNLLVSGLFTLLFIGLLIRRFIVERSEIEPIEKAQEKIKKS